MTAQIPVETSIEKYTFSKHFRHTMLWEDPFFQDDSILSIQQILWEPVLTHDHKKIKKIIQK